MAKTMEKDEKESAEQVLAELRALPTGSLSGEEWLSYLRRLPKPDLPEGWTSADDIRELRGPLPEDDPDFQRNILGRR
jgi:hypothetical protein